MEIKRMTKEQKDLLEAKKEAAKLAKEALQAFIASLPEATAAQRRKVIKQLKSDSPQDVGLNKTFKMTSEANLKAIKNAKLARVKAINTKANITAQNKTFTNREKTLAWQVNKPKRTAQKGKDGLKPTTVTSTIQI